MQKQKHQRSLLYDVLPLTTQLSFSASIAKVLLAGLQALHALLLSLNNSYWLVFLCQLDMSQSQQRGKCVLETQAEGVFSISDQGGRAQPVVSDAIRGLVVLGSWVLSPMSKL